MTNRDESLLEAQPYSAAELHANERANIVICAVVNDSGSSTVISRYGDDVWELWPFFEQANRSDSEKKIDWRKVPKDFSEVLKAVLYRYWKVGRPGLLQPVAGTLRDAAVRITVFLRFLNECNIKTLGQTRPIHIANFVQAQKERGRINSKSLSTLLLCIELLYIFRDEHPDQLTFRPWGDATAYDVAGHSSAAKFKQAADSGTDLIPQEIVATLFAFAEKILNGAEKLLDERDAGLRSPYRDSQLLLVRDACFFILGILTGMRCDELVGVEVGAGRTEIKGGFTFNWVRSIEHKTKKGRVEYLVSSMGLQVLRVMERWSETYRERIKNELHDLMKKAESKPDATLAKRLHSLIDNKDRLFQGALLSQVVSGRSWGNILKEFALAAGVSWNLAPHQLRRTYAWTFVRHRYGNLLLLKEQFKHSSLSMSQLYAANPMQDETLYDECMTELYKYKTDVVQSWISDDEPLSGGAGKKMSIMRANAFPNRTALISETAFKVSIRSTGHSWCLSQEASGCGGKGLYERTRCVTCSSSVIDNTFQPVWRGIYDHQLELLEVVRDMGHGVQQRVERDLARARQVLTDIGVKNLQESE